MTEAEKLHTGDRFRMRGVDVVVLRDREDYTDIFGRGMFRLWCKRDDTGEEGWVPFGPGGVLY